MQNNSLHQEDLMFFGAVSASISHELKNVLAIINEMMGLLDDLSRMAEKGRPLEPRRLQQIAEKMKHQIDRGDGIIRGMNRFAHSVDHPRETIDLNDLVVFVGRLAQRRLATREIALETRVSDTPASTTVNVFAAEHLLWAALDRITQAAAGNSLTLEVMATPDGPAVALRSDSLASSQGPAGGDHLAALARRVGADVSEDGPAGELTIRWPLCHH